MISCIKISISYLQPLKFKKQGLTTMQKIYQRTSQWTDVADIDAKKCLLHSMFLAYNNSDIHDDVHDSFSVSLFAEASFF